jgi:hypothetical protein
MLLLSLSALVKYATLLVGVFATVVWARELRDRRARWIWIGGTLAAAALMTIAIFWPWYAGPRMLGPAVDEINGTFQYHSVPMLVQRSIGEWLPAVTDLEPDAAAEAARMWVYGLARALFVVYLVWEMRRLWTRRDERPAVQVVCAVSARALLIALLLVLTEVHSWYFTWPLTLVVLLGWHSPLTRLVVGYTLTVLPVDYIALFDWNTAIPAQVRFVLGLSYLALPFILPGVMYLGAFSRRGLPHHVRAAVAAALAELPIGLR